PMAGLSRPLRLECSFVTPSWDVPQPRKASRPVWAPPRSLAPTCGITVVFFSSGYEVVSAPLVCPPTAMDSPPDSRPLRRLGSPIRTSPDRSLLTAPRGSIGVRPVLHRLLAPRHPPCALSSLSFRCSNLRGFLPGFTLPYPVFKVQDARQSAPERALRSFKTEPERLRLPRKEVIQPHLPIRLPCYDFTPIICPTFGGWLPTGLPHRLRVLQTLVV